MNEKHKKYLLIFITCLVSLGLDLGSKKWAETHLATSNSLYSHVLVVEVAPSYDKKTINLYLSEEFGVSEEVMLTAIHYGTLIDGKRAKPEQVLATGQKVEIKNHQIEVVENFWHFKYARNPGAAWGFLADTGESFRKPFFTIISILALLFMIYVIIRIEPEQKILAFTIGLITGGALGNFIDRTRYGYVVDFIDWHYYGKHWPTFNVADAAICVGVVIMFYFITFKMKDPKKEQEPSS